MFEEERVEIFITLMHCILLMLFCTQSSFQVRALITFGNTFTGRLSCRS